MESVLVALLPTLMFTHAATAPFDVDQPATDTTAAIGRQELRARLLFYIGLGTLGGILLLCGVCCALYRKRGTLDIGPLSVRRSGIFWQDSFLCCAPPQVSPSESMVYTSVQTSDHPEGGVVANRGAIVKLSDVDLEAIPIEIPEAEKARLQRVRQMALLALFLCYIGSSTIVPVWKYKDVSCANGFFWEDHMPFAFVFFATKIAELLIYALDPTIQGEMTLVSFLTKFVPSFVGYADGYTDATSIAIASSCSGATAKNLSFWMLGTYIVGVVLFQWALVLCLALRDESHACLMKVMHMDALASCVTLPEDKKWIWVLVNFARTIGEDIPQCILQTLFILKVNKNRFMMLSVAMSLGSSLKALIDSVTRSLQAHGAEERLRQEQLGLKLVPAAATGNLALAQELLREGAKVQLMDYAASGGISPLMLAIAASDNAMVKLLRDAGAVMPDMTPQHTDIGAAFEARDMVDVVKLVAKGADIHQRLQRGQGIRNTSSGTTLHACCACHSAPGSYEVIVLLLRQRVDVTLGDAEGDTPLAHAKYYSADHLYALLETNGAEIAGPYYRRQSCDE